MQVAQKEGICVSVVHYLCISFFWSNSHGGRGNLHSKNSVIISYYESDLPTEEKKEEADTRIFETCAFTAGEECVTAQESEKAHKTHGIVCRISR